MELTLQQLLDALAERVKRPAVLEDRFMRLVAYSAHDQAIDGVREDSILRRHASREVKNWLTDFGLATARRPVRLPANPELNMLARVCVPVLYKEKVLGYLWFVDADSTMSSTDIEFCTHEAAEIGAQLHRESVASLFSSVRLADVMHTLLSDSPLAGEAAQSLKEAGYIASDSGVVSVVVQAIQHPHGAVVDLEDVISPAVADFCQLLRRDQVLDLIRKDHCVLILSCSGDDDPRIGKRVDMLVQVLRSALAAAGSSASLMVGVGGARPCLEDVHQSFHEAWMSVKAATLLAGVGDVVYWSRLGIHQLVVKLASLGEQVPVVHRGLGALLDDPDALPLLETLETYLDVAGNAQLTAELLNLHRTSLYYRLQRLEQLAQTDLKDGVERLALHLALKVARMTGQYAPRHGRSDTRERRHPAGQPRQESPAAPAQGAPAPRQRVALTR
ncbi:PucR family transcriptional regulator [Phytoactinopolyspora halotolerans]|uniref:PucR family transcriptional regulator n=1 Tax=Phytoactinopolyspora halotolerans TaxID=1981512 RepID=A0A6L9S546_9ACTN|nr:PucR family transcriptional regulator [Phytoactinopolyspora halotolerans]NEE00219.1 PucR family transcriptional regulator [Phytoactinopolyspora halotolerans]